MRSKHADVLALAAVLAAAFLACDRPLVDRSPPAPDRAVAPAAAALEAVDTVRLAEPDGRELETLTELAVGPAGRFAAVDRPAGHVHLFGAEGELLRVLGDAGGDPLPEPMDAAFTPDGRLAVATLRSPHVHLFSAGGRPVRSFSLRGVPMALQLVAAGDGRLAVYNHRPVPTAPRVGVYDPRGDLLARFHPSPAAYYEIPYWEAATGRLLAAVDGSVVAGGSLAYPFARHDLTTGTVDTVGSPPPSWTAASEPNRGDFRGADAREDFERWRRTFTTVDAFAPYRDSLLAVAHRELDPEVLSHEVGSYRMDLYDGVDPLLRDRPLPGRLLAGGERLWVLGGSPPGGWTLIGYRVTGGGSR